MKEKEFQFYVLNLPIRENKNENIELYSKFFEYIYNRKKAVEIGGDKAAIIRTMTKADSSHKIYYGHITSFTKVGSEWFNQDTLDKEKYEIPKNLFANPKESYYFFLPKFHRIVILKATGGISLTNSIKFFEGIKKLRKYDFDVYSEVSKDGIKEILNADVVKSLVIQFAYSNADTGDDAFDFVDSDMKNSNTESIKIVAKSKSHDGINVKESQILKGSLALATSYGHAEASIIKNNIAKKVKTDDYPLILRLNGNMGDFTGLYNRIYNKIASYFRNAK